MKILYTLNSGTPGGMEQHVLDLVSGFVSRGHEVHVWCKEGVIADWYKNAGAVVTKDTINLDIDPFYISRLYKYIKANTFDVVHSHEVKAGGNTLIASSFAGTKVRLSHVHTPISEWQVAPIKKFLNSVFYTIIVSMLSTKEIALTESRKRVKESEGIPPSKLVVLPNGLNIEKFNIPYSAKIFNRKEIIERYSVSNDSFIVGNVGRLTEEKGIPVLLEAFANFLQNKHIDANKVKLFLVGGGKLEESLKSQAEKLGILDKVIITGVFKDEDLVKFYSTIDLFVTPTLAEGFGIVLLEAMASKLPIICSDLEVLQEVGGSAVVSFEMGNAIDLSEKMVNLYEKKDNLENLKEAAFQRVNELYTLEHFVANYEELYQSLLEKTQ